MTPAKRPSATAASKGASKGASTGRTRPAKKKDSTEEAPTADGGGDSAPPTETGQVDREDRATPQPPRRSRALHPERVWPD